MSLEYLIMTASVVVSILSLTATPKNKLLQMQFTILFIQLPTWLLGLSAVELGLLEYPYRELASVNRTSFIFEYLVLPIVCVHVNNHYPWSSSTLLKAAYLASISLLLTSCEVVFENYTLLIKYTGWKWYWSWISILLIFWLNQKAVAWFFRIRKSMN